MDINILKKNKSVSSMATLEDLEKKSIAITTNVRAEFIKPMLANTIKMPFDKKNWIFETKHDCYRTIAVINPDQVNLF